MAEYETSRAAEGNLARTVEEARALHHLATADPERDGTLTGTAHEEKYGLERAAESAALWRSVGVHPIENRALVGDEDGAQNLRGISGVELENAAAKPALEKAAK